jgi:hypothetical protein
VQLQRSYEHYGEGTVFLFYFAVFFAKLFFLVQLACSYYNNHFHDRLWGEILPDQTKEPMTVAACTCFMGEFAADEERHARSGYTNFPIYNCKIG